MLLEGFFPFSMSKYSLRVENVATKKCCLCLVISMHERMEEEDEGVVCVFLLLLLLLRTRASRRPLRGVNNVRSCARLPDFVVES